MKPGPAGVRILLGRNHLQSSVTTIALGQHTARIYIGLLSLALNLAVALTGSSAQLLTTRAHVPQASAAD